MPKATQPSRFTRAIHQSRVPRALPTARMARQPETRKQTEPRASGVHTRRSYSLASSPVRSASKVETLKNTVPASWIALLHQSSRRGPNRPPSTYCNAAADVKKSEPTKKTTPSISEPTSSTSPGNGPTRKHVEPMANRTPIHQVALRGAHHVFGSPGASVIRGEATRTGRLTPCMPLRRSAARACGR
jgi:hypothetical protein